MKIYTHYKNLAALALAITVVSGSVLAQNEEKKPKDPFTRESGADKKADAGEPETSLVIGLQLARVPSAKVREWDEEALDGDEWRQRVQKLIEQGKAAIVDSIACPFWSGNRGRVQSKMELRYPTELEKMGDSPDDPPFPTKFETWKHGIYFEADPVLNAVGDELDLNFAFEWSRHLGEVAGARTDSERVRGTDVLTPHFAIQKVVTQITFPIGEYQVLTRFKPNNSEEKDGFDIIVFARADLMVASPVSDQDAVKNLDGMKFRATWAEVDAEMWHRELHQNSLSAWFAGKAWETVRRLEKEGGAKILASPVVEARSGQRAKVTIGESLQFQDSFPVPDGEAKGEDGQIEMKTRNLGHFMEFDPVMGTNGIVHLNVNGTSTSLHGHSVSYRKLEADEWVPSVQFPKFYESSVTTQVFIGEDADTLLAVGTPSGEDGEVDASRKWVLFIHNDTFDSP